MESAPIRLDLPVSVTSGDTEIPLAAFALLPSEIRSPAALALNNFVNRHPVATRAINSVLGRL